jgi:hypothetical protein
MQNHNNVIVLLLHLLLDHSMKEHRTLMHWYSRHGHADIDTRLKLHTYTRAQIQVTPAALEQMLFQIALRKEGAWEFRLAPDTEFNEKHPKILAAQEQAWTALEASLLQNRPSKQAQQQKGAQNSKAPAAASKPAEGAASKAAAPKHVPNLGNKPPQQATPSVSAPSAAASLGAQTKELIAGMANKMLKESGVVTKQAILDAAKAHANAKVQEASADAIMATIQPITTVVQGGIVLKKLGNLLDPARTVVLDMFKERPQLKKADIMTAVKEATEQDLTPTNFTKILKEVATTKGNMWVFKTSQE